MDVLRDRKLEEINPLEDLIIDGTIILKRIFNKWGGCGLSSSGSR